MKPLSDFLHRCLRNRQLVRNFIVLLLLLLFLAITASNRSGTGWGPPRGIH